MVQRIKDELVYIIANHMKKCFLNWNKDSVEDQVIFEVIFLNFQILKV